MRPTSRSIRAWAIDPSMSSAWSRRSNPRLLVYSSTPRAVRVPSRPSQTLEGARRAGSGSLRLPRAISAA